MMHLSTPEVISAGVIANSIGHHIVQRLAVSGGQIMTITTEAANKVIKHLLAISANSITTGASRGTELGARSWRMKPVAERSHALVEGGR